MATINELMIAKHRLENQWNSANKHLKDFIELGGTVEFTRVTQH